MMTKIINCDILFIYLLLAFLPHFWWIVMLQHLLALIIAKPFAGSLNVFHNNLSRVTIKQAIPSDITAYSCGKDWCSDDTAQHLTHVFTEHWKSTLTYHAGDFRTWLGFRGQCCSVGNPI